MGKVSTFSKKRILSGIIAITVLSVGIVYATQSGQPAENKQKDDTVNLTTSVEPISEPEEVVEPKPETEPEQAPVQESEPEPEQPKYGEDPDNPGMFIVFDKQAVMDEAGIAQGDRQYVLEMLGGWTYKGTNEGATLCGSPSEKMASAGADYETNPVTQLKWCDGFVKSRYNGWEAAYAFRERHNFW